MDLLVNVFATALALSQVLASPNARTEFDPVRDQPEVVRSLQRGCAYMRQAFEIEHLNLDDLIATAMDDPQAGAAGGASFRGIRFSDMHIAYRIFCKQETGLNSPVDLGEVIAFYNSALADLPDHSRLQNLKLPGATKVLDGDGRQFADVFEPGHRRISVPLAKISPLLQKAFIAAEDQQFFVHNGIDARAIIRAFLANLAGSGGVQGGSTITQQVAKNLLVGDAATYARKMREMFIAARIESLLSKQEILEIYLNSIFLGRGAWGVEMAARSYFSKSADALTLSEAATIAAMAKGPTYYNPDRHPERARIRIGYVLNRMHEDGAIGTDQMNEALGSIPRMIAYKGLRRDSGHYFVDHIAREAAIVADIKLLTVKSYVVRSTINPQVQRATEAALQDGLAAYELGSGRVKFESAEANLSDAIRRIQARRNSHGGAPAWQQALANTRQALYDVHWPVAVVLERSSAGTFKVGLADGRVLPLSVSTSVRNRLGLHDVIYVRVREVGKSAERAELRTRPQAQGAAVVLENRTGRILAMAGGFSYPLSQLNRSTQIQRQPGSALKPLVYLAALNKGLQPNTLLRDSSIMLPAVGGSKYATDDYWSPQNYDGRSYGTMTMREALVKSRNVATVHLLANGIRETPEKSLDQVCQLAVEARIYPSCQRYYSFVLGAQPLRPIDLAAFYAAIANEGVLPKPHAIESISEDGRPIFRHDESTSIRIPADHAAFFQLKSILQDVVQRGTAARLSHLAPYIAGKTGTTNDELDAWFVGFSNDVTIAIWVGFDNARGNRRTLGRGRTGGNVAIPIFEPIMQAVWRHHAARTVLAPPSEEAAKALTLTSDRTSKRKGEYLRRNAKGVVKDTQYALLSRSRPNADRSRTSGQDAYAADPLLNPPAGSWFGGGGTAWGSSSRSQPDSSSIDLPKERRHRPLF